MHEKLIRVVQRFYFYPSVTFIYESTGIIIAVKTAEEVFLQTSDSSLFFNLNRERMLKQHRFYDLCTHFLKFKAPHVPKMEASAMRILGNAV